MGGATQKYDSEGQPRLRAFRMARQEKRFGSPFLIVSAPPLMARYLRTLLLRVHVSPFRPCVTHSKTTNLAAPEPTVLPKLAPSFMGVIFLSRTLRAKNARDTRKSLLVESEATVGGC